MMGERERDRRGGLGGEEFGWIGGRENGERVYTEGEEGRNRQKKGKKGETRIEIGDGERKWERE